MHISPFNRTSWKLAHGRQLELGRTGRIMAIINVTPDSFSDGGDHGSLDAAYAASLAALEAGADILDIGGESTRPGAGEITASEEQARVIPLVRALAANPDIVISVDTYRAETARLAIEAGARIINDVYGLQREPGIARVAAESGAGVVIMHTGRGRDMQADIIDDQKVFLERSLEIARQAGVKKEQIVLDPGFGFNKETAGENIELMNRFQELHSLGYPLLAGTSRKRFLGAITGHEPKERDVGTAATTALLRMAGAALFRVHNVAFNRDAMRVADAMIIQADRQETDA